jgi:hypothetical protein
VRLESAGAGDFLYPLYFLTGDESWFYYTVDHDHMWTPDGEEGAKTRDEISLDERLERQKNT